MVLFVPSLFLFFFLYLPVSPSQLKHLSILVCGRTGISEKIPIDIPT